MMRPATCPATSLYLKESPAALPVLPVGWADALTIHSLLFAATESECISSHVNGSTVEANTNEQMIAMKMIFNRS